MGNMLFEVLNSQFLASGHSFSPQEDFNLAKSVFYRPESASIEKFNDKLNGMTTTNRTDLEPMNALYSKLPALHEQKSQEIEPFHKGEEGRAVLERSTTGVRRHSISDLQTLAGPPSEKNSVLVQRPSLSQNSGPSDVLTSGENNVESQNEVRVVYANHAALDEGSTSSVTHGPVSPVGIKSSVQARCPTSDLPSFAADLTCEQPKLVPDKAVPERKKRKRPRACKNSEEVESQRMTHIAVERNRRKQMNEHLNALRSLMPGSYIQRGDQASIIGGAIEFVRELEQILHSLQLQKHRRDCGDGLVFNPRSGNLLGDLILSSQLTLDPLDASMKLMIGSPFNTSELFAESNSNVANVEVKMAGSSLVVKVLAQKKPQLLLHTLAAIGNLRLTILHLNITTIEQTVLYSFNIEMDFECQLHSANDLALSIQQIFSMFDSTSKHMV